MKRNLLTVVIGAVLIVIFALLLFVFQVRQSEVAVVTTFGKPARNLSEPGAYFKWPWPVQKVYKFDQRIQNFEDKFSENLTADSNHAADERLCRLANFRREAFFPKFPGGSGRRCASSSSKVCCAAPKARSSASIRSPIS